MAASMRARVALVLLARDAGEGVGAAEKRREAASATYDSANLGPSRSRR